MGIAARGELSHSLVPSSSSAAIFGGGFPSLGTTGMCGTAMARESAQRTHGANLAPAKVAPRGTQWHVRTSARARSE